MFTSKRPSAKTKYKYFIIIMPDGNGEEVDTNRILNHNVDSFGVLWLQFEDNEHIAYKVWHSIDYGYNRPQ